jgi:hypothetical protein
MSLILLRDRQSAPHLQHNIADETERLVGYLKRS